MNEFTKITEIEDIKNVNLRSSQIQEHMITAKCMGVEVKKSSSCILCNRKLDDSQLQKETIKCQNYHITILSSVAKTKLVCQLLLQVDYKFLTYTAFNDNIQSFLKNIGCTSAAELDEKELSVKLLSAGTKKIMLDKAAGMISHFLPSEGSQTKGVTSETVTKRATSETVTSESAK